MSSVNLKNIDNEIERVFTTETLEDIISSFKEPKRISVNKIQGPILKKTFVGRN